MRFRLHFRFKYEYRRCITNYGGITIFFSAPSAPNPKVVPFAFRQIRSKCENSNTPLNKFRQSIRGGILIIGGILKWNSSDTSSDLGILSNAGLNTIFSEKLFFGR